MKAIDISGRRVGLLVAVRKMTDRGGQPTRPWECLCECGGTRLMLVREFLRAERLGRSLHCGCRRLKELKHDGSVGQRYRAMRASRGLCTRCGARRPAAGGRMCRTCRTRSVRGAARHRYMTTEERFWACVHRSADDACWEWQGKRGRGYGHLNVNGKRTLAHRYSFTINVGPIPPHLFVCHRCDNPPCVNPAHLFLGTAQDNTADMDAKGRRITVRGEDAGSARLTAEQALAIWRSEGRAAEVGARFGVSAGAVKSIRQGRTWGHVTGGPATYERPKPRQTNRVPPETESNVITMLAAGHRIGEVAARFGISDVTVRAIRRRAA